MKIAHKTYDGETGCSILKQPRPGRILKAKNIPFDLTGFIDESHILIKIKYKQL